MRSRRQVGSRRWVSPGCFWPRVRPKQVPGRSSVAALGHRQGEPGPCPAPSPGQPGGDGTPVFQTLSRVSLPVASFLPDGHVLLVSLRKTFAQEGAAHTPGLCGCAESRAVKCFKNSRKLKTGLSPRRKSCKNLLCLRGVQGREWGSVRDQGQVPFGAPASSKGR